MKTLTDLKSALAGKLDRLEAIRAQFADSREKEVQHYLTWGGGNGYFDVDRALETALNHCAAAQPSPGCRVLDLGAGFGWFGFVCREHGHDVLSADIAHGHCGSKRKSPDCAAMFAAVNECLGNRTTLMEPIRKGEPVILADDEKPFGLVSMLGTLFDRDWPIADYEFLWNDLKKFLAPDGKIFGQSNVSRFAWPKDGSPPTPQPIIVVTAANAAYRPIIAKWLRHAEALGYPALVYDLGGLGLGEHWTLNEPAFHREGHYWKSSAGWPTKGLHKPQIIADALTKVDEKTLLIYLDADALPIDRLDALMQIEFDVAVTQRPAHEMAKGGARKYGDFYGRLNAGVMAFRATEASRKFVKEWNQCTEKAKNDQRGLNQILLGWRAPIVGESAEVPAVCPPGVPVAAKPTNEKRAFFLPPSWNWPYVCGRDNLPPTNWIEPSAKILHFKSKRWQPFAAKPSHAAVMLPDWERNELVRRLPKRATGAEIGVFTGRFSEMLLRLATPRKLHLVDAWMPVENNQDKSREGGPVDHERNYLMTRVRIKPWLKTGQAVIHRGLTRDEIPKFPDAYLDWAYLDANHTYAAVLEDLELLAPKMKPGGIIAGHDYEAGTEWAKEINCGVVEAVKEFCQRNGWRLRWVFSDERRNASYWLNKAN